jgi:tetratricopeptide (TPR) repeat protein
MFCTACGTKNMADSHFCKQCGHKLDPTTAVKISEEAYERSLPADEQITALLERAYQLRTDGKLQLAIALCEESLRLRPDSTSAHCLLAQLYECNGEREAAIAELQRVIELNPASIADRMKLDELRGEVGPAPGRPTPATVTIASRPERAAFRSPVVGLAILLCLFLSGAWAIVSVSNARARSGGPQSGSPSGGAAAALDARSRRPDQAVGSQTAGGPLSAQQPSDEQAAVQRPSSQQPAQTREGDERPLLQPTQPENGTGRSNPLAADAPAVVSAPDPGAVRGSAAPARPQPDRATARSQAQHHVMTNNEPDADPVIKINVHDASKPAGAARTPTIQIRPAAGEGQPASSNHESQSMIAVGSGELKSGRYSSAIQAYVKALPSAGDDAGYVYQQIASCYQYQGDNASAIANYQKALGEFQRLQDGGRLKDRDRDGIKVCKTGISICQSH